MTGQQLKNSILQWAIQGKLVPQDPTDEPASVLLERIRTEKAQLIKEGKLKKGQPTSHIYRDDEGSYYEKVGTKDPVCINHEIPFDLPSGWEWCRLGNTSFIIGGFAFPSESIKGQVGTRVIRISDFNDQGWVDKSIVRYNGDRLLTQYEIHPYDIIMAMTGGTVGKSYYIDTLPERMYLNQRVAIIRLRKIYPKYLNIVVKSPFIIDLISEIKNSTNDNISMKDMSNFLVPLPPLEEQKRIVARIEELMPLVEQYDKAHSELTRLNDQLPEKLKKSILQEAIQGKLVPQDPTDEPASVLLERIRTEKAQLIKEGKLKKGQPTSHIYRDDEGSYYEKVGSKDPVCINHEIPFDLPSGWEWCRLGSLVDFRKNQSVKADEISKDAWLLDLEDIEKDTGTLLQRKRMGSTTSISNKHRFIKGNVLYSKLRPYLNKVIIADEDGYCTSEILCLDFGLVFNKYAQVYLMSPMFVEYAMSCAYGVKMPRLGSEHGNNALYPLPPLEEQKRIVARIEELMPRIDKLR